MADCACGLSNWSAKYFGTVYLPPGEHAAHRRISTAQRLAEGYSQERMEALHSAEVPSDPHCYREAADESRTGLHRFVVRLFRTQTQIPKDVPEGCHRVAENIAWKQ